MNFFIKNLIQRNLGLRNLFPASQLGVRSPPMDGRRFQDCCRQIRPHTADLRPPILLMKLLVERVGVTKDPMATGWMMCVAGDSVKRGIGVNYCGVAGQISLPQMKGRNRDTEDIFYYYYKPIKSGTVKSRQTLNELLLKHG